MNRTSANRLRVFALCVVLSLFGMRGGGRVQATDLFGWFPVRSAAAQLTSQRADLAHRMEREVPDAKAHLDENLRLALSQLDAAKEADSIAWVMDELRSNVSLQLKLPVYQEQCREALIRLDSMIRRIEQEGSLPEGLLSDHERSAGLAGRLMDGGVLEKVGGIGMDDLKVEEALQIVLADHARRGTQQSALPPVRQYGGGSSGNLSEGNWSNALRAALRKVWGR